MIEPDTAAPEPINVDLENDDEEFELNFDVNAALGELRAQKNVKSEREVKPLSILTQYTQFGSDFQAIGKTVPILPPGSYRINATPKGIFFHPQKLSTDSLIELPDSKSEEVINEIKAFWTLKAKFAEFGFSHKRGFLLHGPPGSGKTSTVNFTIQHMINEMQGIVILADHPAALAAGLQEFRAVEPDRPAVVIWEDLDTVINNYGEAVVLAVLDGDAQVDNVVFIATTNYPEKLDGRITNRPSRFDKIVKIDVPGDEARGIYLRHKLKHIVQDGPLVGPTGEDLIALTKGFSIAHLRELIVSVYCQGNAVAPTVERLKKMKVTPKSEGGGKVGFALD